jgi:integrase
VTVSIKKRADGKYRARFRDATGKEHARHFDRRANAQRWEAEQRANVGQVRPTTVSDITGRTYAEQWRGIQPHRPGTQRNYEYTLRLHLYPHIGDLRLPAVRRSDVQALLSDLGKTHAPKIEHNVHRLIAAIMNSAVHDDLLVQLPVHRLSLPAAGERQARPIPAEAVRDIATRVPPRYRALALLAAGTGLRLGECLGLTQERVTFLQPEVIVEAQLLALPNIEPYLGPPKTRAAAGVYPPLTSSSKHSRSSTSRGSHSDPGNSSSPTGSDGTSLRRVGTGHGVAVVEGCVPIGGVVLAVLGVSVL